MNTRPVQSDVLSEEEKFALEGAVLLDPESWDAAIIGVHRKGAAPVAVYDEEKLIEILARESAGDAFEQYENAVEWLEYNTKRALPYMGERAPILAREEDPDFDDVDDGIYIEIKGKRWRTGDAHE